MLDNGGRVRVARLYVSYTVFLDASPCTCREGFERNEENVSNMRAG